jgi:hypothetical protein
MVGKGLNSIIRVFILGFALLVGFSCGQQHKDQDHSEHTHEHHDHDHDHSHDHDEADLPSTGYFGETIDKDGAVAVEEVLGLIVDNETLEVKVIGTIKEVCQHTGCWLKFDFGDGEEIMVRMKDHDFYVPMDAAGKTAWVEGIATREMISVNMLKHYAEDAGKSQLEIDAITEPEMTYTLEAKGVIIE